jgi:hypothetical protein
MSKESERERQKSTDYYNNNNKNENQMSPRTLRICFLIFFAVIIFFIVAFGFSKSEDERMIEAGCIPLAWSQAGVVTQWDCP